jgi:UDP-N-acetylmuramoyl-L-alanyl-D-glutamate--2,6-diaminopimelate ligase
MDIKTLLSDITSTTHSFEVSGLSLNTQSLQKGDIFIALQGEKTHGREYIQNAIDKGCVGVLIEGFDIQCSVPSIRIDDLSSHLANLAKSFYQQANNVNLIGVTGTNGKTSVSLFISQLLELSNVKTGVIGTLGISYLDINTRNTTPDIFTIYKTLEHFAKINIEIAVIEVSSHALIQNRIAGLTLEQAIFTNLTQDHLDYHKDMKQYRAAKGKLFSDYSTQSVIVNRDDENHPYFIEIASSNKTSTYGLDDFTSITASANGFICNLNNCVFELPLLGRFNLSNTLAAFASLKSLGLSDDSIIPELTKLKPPAGRMEKLKSNDIWIDYAHTPDALSNALETIKSHCPKSKLRVIFGCGGDRDQGKRAKMGKIASELADSIILTNDNPRSESPKSITNDILDGINSEIDIQIIHDRGTAIKTAVTTLRKDECLLIAGKGHETTQTIGDKVLIFNDKKAVLDALI